MIENLWWKSFDRKFVVEFLAENIWWNVMVETFGAIAVFDIPEALLIKNIELKQVLTFRKYMVNIWSTTSFESGDK